MKKVALDSVERQGEEMAAAGYFEGVLAARWAEIAIEQQQDDQSVKIYWQLRQLLGME
jgi:hypothetical protein